MKAIKLPKQCDLRLAFDYCAETGRLIRKSDPDRTGTGTDGRYTKIKFAGRVWQLHRLIWVWHNGPIPDGMQIDHINGLRHDNRIENLRLATNGQNQANKAVRNRTGFKGVKRQRSGRWEARIRLNGKRICLGTFDSPEQAHAAYLGAARVAHGEFANGDQVGPHSPNI